MGCLVALRLSDCVHLNQCRSDDRRLSDPDTLIEMSNVRAKVIRKVGARIIRFSTSVASLACPRPVLPGPRHNIPGCTLCTAVQAGDDTMFVQSALRRRAVNTLQNI